MKLFNIISGLIISLIIVFSLSLAWGDIIKGKARVIDGDTIEINNERIRLGCIDTPESNYRSKTQYCLDNETDCGMLSKKILQELVHDKIIFCEYKKRDFYGRILGFCQEYQQNYYYDYKNTYNYYMIENGYAWYYNGGKECKPYKEAFENAKEYNIGLFNNTIGGFKEPKIWRKTRSND